MKKVARRTSAVALAVMLWLSFGGSAPGLAQVEPAAGIRLEPILDGSDTGRALALVDPKDGSDRLFLAQQSGQIRIIENGALVDEPFLDIADLIECCENERGLVGLEFHPDYEDNGFFYVVYVDLNDRTVVSRFSVSANPNVAAKNSEQMIIHWDQPDLPHNGGGIEFGPDGLLYLGSGDGGNRENSQDLENLLGTILRIDVDSASPYAVPDDNPFVGVPDALDEIWVYGLRNPWRFSIDDRTGNLFIGDVGGGKYEEISFLSGKSAGGTNFGWPIKEGPACLENANCDDESLVDPIISYDHVTDNCNSVTGGHRYRGKSVPTLRGFYIYGDFCRGTIWGAKRNSAGRWVVNELLESGQLITSFGEDADGNLYLVHFRGDVFRIVGQHLFASEFESGNLSDWSRRRGGVAVVDGGLAGSDKALEVSVGKAKSFVRSKEPSAEKTFRVGFDLSLNGVNLADGEAEIFRLAGSGKRGHLRLVVEQTGNRYHLALRARNNSGGFRALGRTLLPRSRTVRIELDWLAASGPEAGDGEVFLSKNGKVRISATDLDTDKRKIGSATLGFPAGSAGDGTILFDNYVSSP